MQRVAVIPAQGMGDALLMMIAAHRLQTEGHSVTVFHPKLPELAAWFPTHHFEQHITDLSDFDLIIAQNDNSPRIREWIQQHRQGDLPNLSIFYPSYEKHKHESLSPLDQVFDAHLPMADNIAIAIARALNLPNPSKENGLTPLEGLVRAKYPQRIILHASAGEKSKVWPLSHFILVADRIKKMGYHPVFVLSPKEKEAFGTLPYPAPLFQHFGEAAAYLYESGGVIGNDSSIGHLASNIGLPTLIIADCAKRMKLWRPGWKNGEVVTPPLWIPNFKGSRIRKTYWRMFTPPTKVIRRATMTFALENNHVPCD